jgi:hypothetical protein
MGANYDRPKRASIWARVGDGSPSNLRRSTLNELDSTFQSRYLDRLEKAYSELRGKPATPVDALQEMSWVRELLTGFSVSDGQGKPFLE